jgi:hypothetical protein
MKNIFINGRTIKAYQIFTKFAISGGLILTMVQTPLLPAFMPGSTVPFKTIETPKAKAMTISNTFFGEVELSAESQDIVTKQIDFVSTRKAYEPSLAVITKHSAAIKRIAKEKGVPEDIAIGVAFLENGGSETAKSPAGALGIYQLMPGTARNLGLTVNKKIDERKNPEKSIEAGITYLASNYERFGDWGLATWAYHAGEGNVAKAIKLYAKKNDNIKLPGVENSPVLREYVESHNITIHKLLSDSSVKAFTDKLNDDTAGYPYKVLATATLFKEASSE